MNHLEYPHSRESVNGEIYSQTDPGFRTTAVIIRNGII